MRPNRLNLIVFTPALLLFFLLGCLGPGKSTPTRFYVLTSVYSEKVKPAPVADLKNTAIGVGPLWLVQFECNPYRGLPACWNV